MFRSCIISFLLSTLACGQYVLGSESSQSASNRVLQGGPGTAAPLPAMYSDFACNPATFSNFTAYFSVEFPGSHLNFTSADTTVFEQLVIMAYSDVGLAVCDTSFRALTAAAADMVEEVTDSPSSSPSMSAMPSDVPSLTPSASPTSVPSDLPSMAPSATPSIALPSDTPSALPSSVPTISPMPSVSAMPSTIKRVLKEDTKSRELMMMTSAPSPAPVAAGFMPSYLVIVQVTGSCMNCTGTEGLFQPANTSVARKLSIDDATRELFTYNKTNGTCACLQGAPMRRPTISEYLIELNTLIANSSIKSLGSVLSITDLPEYGVPSPTATGAPGAPGTPGGSSVPGMPSSAPVSGPSSAPAPGSKGSKMPVAVVKSAAAQGTSLCSLAIFVSLMFFSF